MINENEENSNDELLHSFFKDSIPVHIVLKRILKNGKNSWLNGLLVGKATDKVWILQERELGEVRVALGEIADFGVSKFAEMEK